MKRPEFFSQWSLDFPHVGASRLMLAVALWTSVVPVANAADTALADVPIASSQEAVPANVMLALSVEFPTALSHANFSQGENGVTALPASSTEDPYFETTRKYLGYFDPAKCYTFSDSDGYFKYSSDSNSTDYSCANQWSGNYLNWATMQVVDLFRWAMTGGARDVDEPVDFTGSSTSGKTVLKKAWSNSQGQQKNFPNKILQASLIKKYTALSGSGTKNLIAIVLNKGIDVEFSYSSNYSAGSLLKSYPVKVLVCDGTDTTKHEYPDNFYCQKYQNPDKDKTVYKPVGLIQKNINKMRFGAVSYLNLNTSTYGSDSLLQARDGGVVKAQIRDTKLEILPTGAFPADPFPDDKGGDADVTRTGAINFLNLFGYKSGSYKRYDNVSEMYAVALRYLLGPSGIGNVAAFSDMPSNLTATQIANIKDDFPVITKWDDPVFSALNGGSCQKQFIIGIGDTNTCCDSNLSGGASPINPAVSSELFAGETANAWVKKISGYDLSKDYIAGLAYAANTKALRADFPDMRIKTFWVDALEYSVMALNNQYQKAAKYGAFTDSSGGNGVPDNGEWNALKQTYKGKEIPDAYFPASDPDRMLSGLSSAFSQINSLIGAGAGVGVTSASISETLTSDATFQTRYDSQYWSGDIRGMKIDSINVNTGAINTTMKWSAASKLDTAVQGGGWDTGRNIVTLAPNGSDVLVGVPFRLSSLSASQKSSLGSTSTEQADILNYLRGDTSKQSTLTVRNAFRYRASVLGDIVDSGAVFVGAPSEVYADAYNPGYADFKAAKAGRTPVVYVGANDGMLHAFNAEVDSSDGGSELFALVPNAVFKGPDNQPSTSGLRALADNGYLHHYYVNATPFVRDVDFKRAGGSVSTTPSDVDWRTLLVVGLGKGGRSYVALDVSDPSSFTSETAVAGKVLWEFTHEDMGFSYGRPLIVKTRKWGWVVIIAAGYNNTQGTSNSSSPGKGVIFVLNPKDGTLLQKIKTNVGSAASPAGLAHLSGYVPDYSDMKLDQLYAGDLFGNLWRFDFTSATAAVPDQTTPIAKLESPVTNAAQPITTEPLVEIASDLVRYVFVGTGRLLHTSDRENTQAQTFYALRDGTVTNPYSDVTGAPNQLPSGVSFPVKRANMVRVTSLIEGVTLADGKPMGWYYDLTGVRDSLAEQIVINPQANEGLVSWVGTLMNQDKCNPAGESATYAVKYGTAKSAFAKIDNNARVPIEFVSSSAGLVGLRLVRYGSSIRLMGSFSQGESGPAFIGSQVGGIGDPRVMNWRIIGQ